MLDHSLAKALITLWSMRPKADRRRDLRTIKSSLSRIQAAGLPARAGAPGPALVS
jgi:hypothetical protein